MTQPSVARPEHNLDGVALLKGLDGESLRRVEESCGWRRYEPGEPIVEYLDRSDEVFFLVSGEARVIVYSLAGRVVSFHDLSSGDMFGELPAFDGRPRSASVSALRDCKLSFVSRSAFEAVAGKNPDIYKHLLSLLAARLRDTDQVVAAGTFLPVKGRVARALLDLAKAFGNEVGGGRIVIRQKLSQSDVAAMAGIARENVSRILNEWMRLKLVTRLSGYYCIESKPKLEKELKV